MRARIICRLVWFAASLVVASCRSQDQRIPERDGPLTVNVTFPLDSTPVPAIDSTPLWGTVGTGRASLTLNGEAIPIERNGTFAAFVPIPPGPTPLLRLVAKHGDDSVVRTIVMQRAPATVTASDDSREGNVREWVRWVTMRRLPSDTADSATQWRPIYSRWRPGGEVAMPLPQGMRLFSDRRTDRSLRIRLAPDEHVWIPLVDADTTVTSRASVLQASAPTTRVDSSSLLISIPLRERLPTTVELAQDHLYWTIYGASWSALPPALDGDGNVVRRIVVIDSAPERLVLDLQLAELPLGWRTEWHNGALHLRIRAIPPKSTSLRGLIVALDAGHPPDGTTGPSGLREDSATLEIAKVAAAQLRELGANVLMTRETRAPLSLEARAVVADQSPAHLFVSIHLNAPGAGRPPEAVFGAQTYWMHPNSRPLSVALVRAVAKSMQHPAIGSYQGEYAVLRPTWTAAVLLEGSGIVLPEREAFLRTSAGIAAYAQGIVDGIVSWMGSTDARRLPGAKRPSGQ